MNQGGWRKEAARAGLAQQQQMLRGSTEHASETHLRAFWDDIARTLTSIDIDGILIAEA